jgi:hypothetical protein
MLVKIRRKSSEKEEIDNIRKLKFPRINDYDLTNKVKYCLSLKDDLNFISKSSRHNYKKLVMKQNHDLAPLKADQFRHRFA